MNFRRILAPAITLAVLFGLVALFRYVQRYDPSRQAGAPAAPDVSVRLVDATIIARTEGVPRWSVHADTITVKPQAYGGVDSFRSAEFQGIRDGVFYRDGKKEAAFSVHEATYDQPTQQFTLRGGLRMKTVKGDQVEAPECIWSERADFARLPKGAKGVFSGNRVSAPFLLYAPKQRVVQCPQGAEGTFDGYPLRAAALFWDVPSGHVHCTGAVSGERKDLSYTVREAFLDLKNHTIKANNGTAVLRIGSEDDLEGLR